MTTQDLAKGIDILALNSVSGSELNQLVDAGRLGPFRGMVIETIDTGPGVPDVPDPNGNYLGVFPTWWKRYIWRRVAVDGDEIQNYCWDENIPVDGTTLFWSLIDKNGRDALTIANTALTNAATAQNTADTAQTNATNAQTSADAAQATADNAQAVGEANSALITETITLVANVWGSGDLKHTCKTTVYSTTEDQGWLECDGTAVDRVVFAPLFAVLGTTWGVGNGTTTFNIPDFRGRTLIGAGTGSGLTARSLGQQTIGEETHLLTGVESGIAAHHHTTSSKGTGGAETIIAATNAGTGAALVSDTSTTGPTNAASPHGNVQPSAVSRILIKT